MTEKINLLYCFDQNYNNQAFSSMISFLDNVSKKINIIVIHNQLNLIDDIPDCIINHKNLDEIKAYKFEEENYYFPNLDNNHISEATYYRIFIENYLEPNIKTVVYIDADTICINDPTNNLEILLNELIVSTYTISARTEINKNEIENYIPLYEDDPILPFKRLNIDSLYFNAGVMLIDFSKWRNKDLTNKLIIKLNKLRDDIVTWDQDVINSEINGEYIPLPNSLNCFQTEVNKNNEMNKFIIHYLGSNKPWYCSGVFMKSSKYYHQNYFKHQNKRYHIIHLWKKQSLIDLFNAIWSGKILSLDKPLSFIKEFTLTLFKSDR